MRGFFGLDATACQRLQIALGPKRTDGALMFAFFSAGTSLAVRTGLMVGAWVFGYYLGIEVVKRKIMDFDTAPLPSFVAAFFCVAVFKLLLAVFNEDGKAWVRKQLGLKPEGPKDE